jgi:hypothetical protein
MATTDFLPVATSGGANVDSQADFAGSSYQLDGFVAGIAQPTQANKIWRQASMIAAALTTAINNVTGENVVDDGNLATLTAQIQLLITEGSASIACAMADETGSRALGSTYHNATASIMVVCVTVQLNSGSYGEGFGARASVGSASPSSWVASCGAGNSPGLRSMTFTVPPGYYYNVTQDNTNVLNPQTPNIGSWVEYLYS